MDSMSRQEGTQCVWIRMGQWELKVRNCLCEFGCSFARIWLPVQHYVTRSQYGDCFTVLFVSVTTVNLPKDGSSSLNGADPYHHSSSSLSMSSSPPPPHPPPPPPPPLPPLIATGGDEDTANVGAGSVASGERDATSKQAHTTEVPNCKVSRQCCLGMCSL